MTRRNPHSRSREHDSQDQYSTYYQGGRSQSYAPDSSYPPEAFEPDFAPPKRATWVDPRSRTVPRQIQPPMPQPRPVRSRQRPPRSRQVLLAGGSMLALAAFVVGPRPFLDRNTAEETTSTNVICDAKVQEQSVLSRAELSQLLAVAERAPKEEVRAVIDEPYCTLPPVKVREGAVSEREAYPLEFNPQTWFIVLYEEGEYAGYDFSFYRD